jgi:molybdopterin-synthase adenylyltransferase
VSADRAHILIVGMGGLGCPASLSLAKAPVKRLTLVDPDAVELTNLHRQPWFRTSDIGKPKVLVAAERLRAAFPRLEVEAVVHRLGPSNVESLLQGHQIAIDGTDEIEAKFLLSDAVASTNVPVVYGGVLRMHGQVMAILPGGPCLRCLFERAPAADELPTCSGAGVLGSVAGAIGALQAITALRVLRGELVPGEMLILDGQSLRHRRITVGRALDCRCARPKGFLPEVSSWPT